MSPEWRENLGVISHNGTASAEILRATREQSYSSGPRMKPWGTPMSVLGEVVTERRDPETMIKKGEREKQVPQ